MFDTQAMEHGRAQRALCSEIEPSHPHTPTPVGPCQLRASIKTIRPTQITVGFREVEAKRRRYREALGTGGPMLPRVPVPIILGRGATLYALDRHHWLCALRAEGVSEVAIRVVDDLSGLGPPSFWRLLDDRGWCHPFDVEGRQRGYEVIPESLGGLEDDPFRSLASALRRVGGFEKDRMLFSEFQWADYLRRHIDPSRLAHDFDGALATAVRLSRRRAARTLPGLFGGDGVSGASHDTERRTGFEGGDVVEGGFDDPLSHSDAQ